jgi:FkbM family methyltransferase
MTISEMTAGISSGYFLDVGAGRGIEANRTYDLECRGWTGLCIEPVERFYLDLLQTRKCRCRQALIAPVAGPTRFALAKHSPWSSGLLEFYNQAARSDFVISEVQAHTIGQILDEESAPATIDFWNLDTEGSELAILKSFPWDTRSVRSLCVEHNAYLVGETRQEELRAFLTAKGFHIVGQTKVDLYAVMPPLSGP